MTLRELTEKMFGDIKHILSQRELSDENYNKGEKVFPGIAGQHVKVLVQPASGGSSMRRNEL